MAGTKTKGAPRRRPAKRQLGSSPASTTDVKPRASARKLSQSSTKSTRQPVVTEASDIRKKTTIRLSNRKGKAPIQQDVPMPDAPAHDSAAPLPDAPVQAPAAPPPDSSVDDDEAVEEYDFTKEPDFVDDAEDEDLLEDDDNAHSVITLSSEPSNIEEAEYQIDPRPWINFSEQTRKDWEIMYSNVTPYAMVGSWAKTEEYQREKDNEMLRYMDDFPLPRWVIPQQQASNAYYQLVERMRWRNFGIPIYGRDRVPASSPEAGRPFHALGSLPSPAPHNSWLPPPGPGPSQYIAEPFHQAQPQGPSQQIQQPMQAQAVPPQMSSETSPQQIPGQPMPYAMPQQHMGPPQHLIRGQYPQGILLSQPYAQPVPVQHGPQLAGTGQPIGQPQSLPYGIPLGTYIGHPVSSAYAPMPGPAPAPPPAKAPRKPREKKETPATGTPPPPAPTPPYESRTKPVELQKPPKKPSRATGKSSKRPVRRQAEAEEFPWTRQIDFPDAKHNAEWDDTIYDEATLDGMKRTRDHNIRLIDNIDARLQEMQRQARIVKKMGEKSKTSSETESKPKEKKKRGANKNDAGDHSGGFTWVDADAEKLGKEMGFAVPDDAIDAGLDGKLDNEQMNKLRICWNPGKKGVTEELEQATFSVRDSVLTRKQLEKTPILNRRAAECIIDFCPDLMWRGMLLRVCSEGGYGNKDVRDRFCYNGCYCDKATITKRISAALGQKQVQPKSKGYAKGELEWYEWNVKDFTYYIEYFGRRTGHRNMLKIQMQSDKRRAAYDKRAEEAERESTSPAEGPSTKRRKLDTDGAHTSDVPEDGGDGEETETGEEGEETEENDDDAVSAQDSDILDEMDDSN